MERGFSPSPKPLAMMRRDLSHRYTNCNALVLQTFICVKGGDVSAWFNVACVRPPPSSSISDPLSRKLELRHDKFICVLGVESFWFNKISYVWDSEYYFRGELSSAFVLLLASHHFKGKEFGAPSRVFIRLLYLASSAESQVYFSLLLMSNHFGVALIVLFKPCSPSSVFTINWSSFRVSAKGIPMEPLASDHWKIRRSHEEVGQANNAVLQQLMAKLREIEEIMVGLSHRMEEKYRDFEVGLSTLARRMEEMEVAFLHLRDPGYAQRSTSDSVNPGRPFPNDVAAENDPGNSDRGTAPMDIEEEPLNLSQASEIQDTCFKHVMNFFLNMVVPWEIL
jgi:hypothetical protein